MRIFKVIEDMRIFMDIELCFQTILFKFREMRVDN
jgi:hypothetical protein